MIPHSRQCLTNFAWTCKWLPLHRDEEANRVGQKVTTVAPIKSLYRWFPIWPLSSPTSLLLPFRDIWHYNSFLMEQCCKVVPLPTTISYFCQNSKYAHLLWLNLSGQFGEDQWQIATTIVQFCPPTDRLNVTQTQVLFIIYWMLRLADNSSTIMFIHTRLLILTQCPQLYYNMWHTALRCPVLGLT